MKRTIIIYYSLEGNCQLIAETLAQTLAADCLRLQPQKELNKDSFSKYVFGGKQAILQQKPQLCSYQFHKSAYDRVILGAPVWAGRFAAPLNTFIAQNDLSGLELALFCCHRGGMGHALEKFSQQLKPGVKLPQIDFLEPKNQPEKAASHAQAWAEKLR